MAKKSAVLRDLKRRKLYEKHQTKRAKLKATGDLEGLQKLPRNSSDDVAYIRFASVYREFKDSNSFVEVCEKLEK